MTKRCSPRPLAFIWSMSQNCVYFNFYVFFMLGFREIFMNTISVKRKLTGASVGIPPRHVTFSMAEDSPRYFYGNNATATIFFAMLSGAFPPGERFFMESVRRFRDRIEDDHLKAQVSGFMGQEAIHGREHDRLNAMLAERGFDMEASDKIVKLGLKVFNLMPPSTRLAATTFMEHFTALLAEQLLKDEGFVALADPEMIKIWQWHALEELEHKAVAYDVYDKIGNSRLERLVAALASSLVLIPMLGGTWAWMLAKEGKLGSAKDNINGINMLFGKNGFITKTIPKMPLFCKQGFHPKDHDTSELESAWREILFGKNGTLAFDFKNKVVLQESMH